MKDLPAKQKAIADRIMSTTDERMLDSINELLNSGVDYSFSQKEIEIFEERLAEYKAGNVTGSDWSSVKQRIQAQLDQ